MSTVPKLLNHSFPQEFPLDNLAKALAEFNRRRIDRGEAMLGYADLDTQTRRRVMARAQGVWAEKRGRE